MRVIVSRSGGIAGRRATWEVDIADQPDESRWQELIERVPWSDPPPASPGSDRFVYRITCEPHDATVQEQQLRGPWRDLVDLVRSRGSTPPSPRPAPPTPA